MENFTCHCPCGISTERWSPTGQVITLEAEVWHRGKRSVVCIVSRRESLAKTLISVGVSGDKWRVFHQESKWFGKAPLPGRLAIVGTR